MNTPSSKYFQPKELIQHSLFESISENALMRCIGHDTCNSLDMLREDYEGAVRLCGALKTDKDIQIFINGFYEGRMFECSGLRSVDCPVGAKFSRHKSGNTFDLKCNYRPILLNLIMDNYQKYGIERIENPQLTPTWLHVEFNIYADDLKVFNP